MKTIAIIESKVINTIATTSGTFYILNPIAEGLDKIGVADTDFNYVKHIRDDESVGHSATCPTIKVCRKGLHLVPGFFGKKVCKTVPEKEIIISIRVSRCEGLEKLAHGEYFFSID